MKILSTKVHGTLDYLMGLLLIAAPWLFGFADGSAAQWVPVILGIMMIVMSICTDYEFGMVKAINMTTHLTMDFISGAFLAASPWLFNFDEYVYLPHLILGVSEMVASLITSRVPYERYHTA